MRAGRHSLSVSTSPPIDTSALLRIEKPQPAHEVSLAATDGAARAWEEALSRHLVTRVVPRVFKVAELHRRPDQRAWCCCGSHACRPPAPDQKWPRHLVLVCSTKEALPQLAGVRLKTRKRNIVVKHDPQSFADAVVYILQVRRCRRAEATAPGRRRCRPASPVLPALARPQQRVGTLPVSMHVRALWASPRPQEDREENPDSLEKALDASAKELESSELDFSRYGDVLFEVGARQRRSWSCPTRRAHALVWGIPAASGVLAGGLPPALLAAGARPKGWSTGPAPVAACDTHRRTSCPCLQGSAHCTARRCHPRRLLLQAHA